MGCGECDSITKSTTSGALISDASAIYKEAKTLFERIQVPCQELRGVGVQLTKLEKIPPVNTALSNFLNAPSVSKVVSKSIEKMEDKPSINVNEKRVAVSSRGRGRGRGGRKNVPPPSNNIGRYFKNQNNDVVCFQCNLENFVVT